MPACGTCASASRAWWWSAQPPSDPQRVFFGARVTLADANGATRDYRIVGPDEFDQEPGGISMDAPLARALLGKALDDEVTVALADGSTDVHDRRDRVPAAGSLTRIGRAWRRA